MAILEALAIPAELRDVEDGGVAPKSGLDTRTNTMIFSDMPISDGDWPFTIDELAQNLIISVLRGNAKLCKKSGASLVALFVNVVNLSIDVSVSPALELLFILAKPEVTT